MITALLVLSLAWGDPPSAELSPERLQRLRAYRNEYLRVASFAEVTGGGANFSPSLAFGPMQMSTDPIRTVRGWGIYQGAAQVPIPAFYRAVGQEEIAVDLEHRIHRHRTASNVLYGVGVASALATGYALYALTHETNANHLDAWSSVATGGLIGMVVGFSVGGLPASRAERLNRDPAVSLTPTQAATLADSYNEALRVRLGVTPEDAVRVELSEAPRQ